MLISSGGPGSNGQRAVSGHRGVDRPPAGVEHGRSICTDVWDPVVTHKLVARGCVSPALVEDPADVIIQDALIRFRIQRISLRSAAKDSKLKKVTVLKKNIENLSTSSRMGSVIIC